MTSLRRRLALGVALTVVITVGLAATAVALLDRHLSLQTVDQVMDAQLRADVFRASRRLHRLRHAEHQTLSPDRQREPPPDQEPDNDDQRGSVVAWSLDDDDLQAVPPDIPPTLVTMLRALPADGAMRTISSPSENPLRVRAIRIDHPPRRGWRQREGEESDVIPPPQPIVVAQIRDLSPLMADLRQRHWLLGATVVIATLLATAVAWLLAGRLLRPLDHLGATIAAMPVDGHPHQVSVAAAPQELQPVITRLNELVARVAAAVQRERRVNADIAHELRTPLAGMRSQLEFALRDSDRDELYAASATALSIAMHMQDLVENLLALVRLDSQQTTAVSEDCDLHALVMQSWNSLAARALERHIDLDLTMPAPCMITSDPSRLRQVIANLLGNAIAHGDPDSRISVSYAHPRLTIRNLCTGIDPQLVDQAREPFWRGDQARTDTGAHCGLGLSIASRLCAVLGTELHLCAENNAFEAALDLTPRQPPTGR